MHSSSSGLVEGSKRESHTSPALLLLALICTKLPALNAACASLAGHSPETLQGQQWQTVTHFLWDCTRTSFRQQRLSLTQMKRQLRSQHLLEWLFCDVPVSKPQMLPSAHKSRSHRIVEHPHTAAGRATLEQWELNNKPWLYSKSW